MTLFHIEHKHFWDTCFGFDESKLDLWRQVVALAPENGVTVHYFTLSASQHVFFLLLEAPDYSAIEKTINHCRQLGPLTITPVTRFGE
ncbi:MAG: hypothetical protein CL793_03990 [Chloroflexi bacterium]|nr:hypothetical protein [Chloroflexota bacterium]